MQCLLFWLDTRLQHLPVPVQRLLLLLPCRSLISRNRSLPKRRHRTLFLRLFVPVTQASTPGGSANARSFALATAITRDSCVFSMLVKTLSISGQAHGFLSVASSLMASACVSAAATGCKNMIPRPYRVVKRRGPEALYKYWGTGTRTSFWPRSDRQLLQYFGRDQIDNFSGILAETRSTTSPVFWPRSDRDPLLLRVGDRALASQPDAPCAHMCFTNSCDIYVLGFWQHD